MGCTYQSGDGEEVSVAELASEEHGGAHTLQTATGDDSYPVTQHICLVHVVCRQNYRPVTTNTKHDVIQNMTSSHL